MKSDKKFFIGLEDSEGPELEAGEPGADIGAAIVGAIFGLLWSLIILYYFCQGKY